MLASPGRQKLQSWQIGGRVAGMFKANGILGFWRVAMWSGAAARLGLPAIAMSFFPDAGVNWTGSDFVAAGLMLFIAGVAVEVGAYLADDLPYFAGIVFAVGTGFVTVWANGAVGMIRDEGNPQNLVFLAVIALAVVGALVARFRAEGMAKAMLAVGALQAAIGLYVGVMGLDDWYTAGLIAGFALPWLLSAALFRLSASGRNEGLAPAA
jgi:hypothetical protein